MDDVTTQDACRTGRPAASGLSEQSAAGRPSGGTPGVPQSGGEDRHCPLSVIRGAECQVSVTVDWFNGASPSIGSLLLVVHRFNELWGAWRDCKGKHGYGRGQRWMSGAEVWYTPVNGEGQAGMCVSLNGDALGSIAWDDRLDLLAFLIEHVVCTRLDLAVDYRGERVRIIEEATASADRGELCRCRVHKPVVEKRDNEVTAYGLNLGRRGKAGSGRYVRTYDKGLETGECPRGQWVRWEAELSKKVADSAVRRVLAADDPAREIRAIALGCVDFRMVTGDAHLDRRPRARWFLDLVQDARPVRVAAVRPAPSADRRQQWLRRCVYRSLQAMAANTGTSIETVLQDVCGDLGPHPDPQGDAAAMQYAVEVAPRSASPRPSEPFAISA